MLALVLIGLLIDLLIDLLIYVCTLCGLISKHNNKIIHFSYIKVTLKVTTGYLVFIAFSNYLFADRDIVVVALESSI